MDMALFLSRVPAAKALEKCSRRAIDAELITAGDSSVPPRVVGMVVVAEGSGEGGGRGGGGGGGG